MNPVNKIAVRKRALENRHERIKSVKMTYLRNKMIRLLAVLLPMTLLLVMIVDFLGKNELFVIEKIEYRGAFDLVNQVQVNEVTQNALQGNFFTVNLEGLKSVLEKIDWVKSVSVDKRWPDTLSVNIEEHQPVTRWQSGGWIVVSGELIQALNPGKLELDRLPLLDGNELDIHLILAKYRLWSGYLQKVGLDIVKIQLSEANSWSVSLAKTAAADVELRLGKTTNIDQRLISFIQLYERSPAFFEGVEYIDARYPNGVAIKALNNKEHGSSSQSETIISQKEENNDT